MKPIIIFGTGDIAQLANFYFTTDSPHTVAGFTVDREFIVESFEGKPVISFDELPATYPPSHYDLFIALSYRNMNAIRERKYMAAKSLGYQFATYVSSRCSYLSQFQPGDNCFILEDNTIQPFVRIGNNVTLWSGNHVGHHSTIEDHNFISSHVVISGHCHIESNCFIGVNATLHNGIRVKTQNVIGAGAILTRDTERKGVYLPAKTTLFTKSSDEINF